MNETFKIAIDGPSGSGKSTLAKNLAGVLRFVYIDTGALYRAVGLFALRNGITDDNLPDLIPLLPGCDLEMRLENGGSAVYLGGERLGDEIRTPQASHYASQVSKLPEVRAFLLETQRSIARVHNVIMDGRDIGTVVLPDAQVKLFLTASPEERAKRRAAELAQKGIRVDAEQILADMKWRDANDRNRAVAPAVPAPDAVLLDSTALTREGMTDKALSVVRAAGIPF